MSAVDQGLRVADLDYDARRDPKTDRFCARCQKDLKPGQPFRAVHIVDGGCNVLHPDDEAKYVSDAGDMYWFRVGMDCAKKIGIEFTHPGDVYPENL